MISVDSPYPEQLREKDYRCESECESSSWISNISTVVCKEILTTFTVFFKTKVHEHERLIQVNSGNVGPVQ